MFRKRFIFIFLLLVITGIFVSESAYADPLGQGVNFNVNSEFDKYKRTSLGATLRHIGDRSYFYVEDSYWDGLNSLGQNTLTANIKTLANIS